LQKYRSQKTEWLSTYANLYAMKLTWSSEEDMILVAKPGSHAAARRGVYRNLQGSGISALDSLRDYVWFEVANCSEKYHFQSLGPPI